MDAIVSSLSLRSWKLGFFVGLGLLFVCVLGLAFTATEGNYYGIIVTTPLFIIAVILFGKLLSSLDIKSLWRTNTYLIIVSVLSLGVSHVHFQSDDHVWVLGGKTTITNQYLVAVPWGPFAKKINLDEYKIRGIFVTAMTKDGKEITAQISGSFRVMNNESTLLNLADSLPMANLRGGVDALIGEILKESFIKEVAEKELSELTSVSISKSMNAVDLSEIGIVTQGVIIVQDLRFFGLIK